ncbi:MAG: RNA polymerase subunit sigma, partial [Planctomycetaceae bacterium]|nr:RNA polymerase subunit sigma [Planctomycetaceae bacterium]
VDNALRKKSLKRGGDRNRVDVADVEPAVPPPRDDLLALNEALDQLAEIQPQIAELVKFRFFAGFTNKQSAELLGISPRKANSLWAYAKVWLHDFVVGEVPSD